MCSLLSGLLRAIRYTCLRPRREGGRWQQRPAEQVCWRPGLARQALQHRRQALGHQRQALGHQRHRQAACSTEAPSLEARAARTAPGDALEAAAACSAPGSALESAAASTEEAPAACSALQAPAACSAPVSALEAAASGSALQAPAACSALQAPAACWRRRRRAQRQALQRQHLLPGPTFCCHARLHTKSRNHARCRGSRPSRGVSPP